MKEIFFEDLDIDELAGKTIILDIDGTLVEDGSELISQKVLQKILMLRSFSPIFLSTNKRDATRNAKIEDTLGLAVLSKYKKPSTKILNDIPENLWRPAVVIGDKSLVDGLFAYRIGARFIKVKHKYKGDDGKMIKFVHFFDSIFFTLMKGILWRI